MSDLIVSLGIERECGTYYRTTQARSFRGPTVIVAARTLAVAGSVRLS